MLMFFKLTEKVKLYMSKQFMLWSSLLGKSLSLLKKKKKKAKMKPVTEFVKISHVAMLFCFVFLN